MGYLASRIPVQALLKLRHPDAEHGKAEPPWCAWDVCEGKSAEAMSPAESDVQCGS